MIDWGYVFSHSLWLAGLALLLSVFSFTDYQRRGGRFSLREMWQRIGSSAWTRLGGALFCAGIALSNRSWLEVGVWALLGLGLTLSMIYNWSKGWSKARRKGRRNRTVRATAQYAGREPGATNGSPPATRRSPFRTLAEWIVKTEFLWLALLFPFFLFPSAERLPALFGLPALWIARRIARGRFVPSTPLDWPIVVMMLMVLVSVLVTYSIELSLPRVTTLLFGIGLFYAVVELALTRKGLRLAIGGYVLAGVALAVFGLLAVNWPNKLPTLQVIASYLPNTVRNLSGRPEGINPNIIAGTLLGIAPLQVALAIWTWKGGWRGNWAVWGKRLGLLALAAITGSTLILMQSRGAWSAFAIACLLLLWMAGRRLRIMFGAALLIAAGVVIYIGPQSIIGSVPLASEVGRSVNQGLASGISRTELWSRAIYGLEDFPFTGMGVNTFGRLAPILYPLHSSNEADVAHPHNQFLAVGVDLGLPGLIGYTAIWMISLTLAAQAWQRSSRMWRRGVAIGVSASLLGLFIFGIADAMVLGSRVSYFFWALLGLLVALWKQSGVMITKKAARVGMAQEQEYEHEQEASTNIYSGAGA